MKVNNEMNEMRERDPELIRKFLVQVLGWMAVPSTKGERPGVKEIQETRKGNGAR